MKTLLFLVSFYLNTLLCSSESVSCTGHDACKNKVWDGEYDITCGAANSERTCKSTTLNCGSGKDCTIKTQGSGHDAYQNSVVNAKESNSFKLTCQATGLRDCQSITIWCPQSPGSTCECVSCPSSVTMKCVQGVSCDSVSNANIDYVEADEVLDGYVPELNNGPNDCCKHTAPWDDPFTLMCQTCAYDVIGKLKTDITYKWYSSNDLKYEITCYTTGEYSVRCNGKNNENGGRPSYAATCGTDCITDYDKIPGKEYVWLKNTQNQGKSPDCPKVPIPGNNNNQNYKWGTLEQCKKSCIMEPTGKCNMLSRYGEGIKELTEAYHCRFYACPEPFNFNWVTQEQWGNYASSCQTYMLPIRHNILQQCDNIINKTRWKNDTRWTNKTNWIDKIRWENKTNIIDKIRWTNKTRWINKTRWENKTNIINKIRWINKTSCKKDVEISTVKENNKDIKPKSSSIISNNTEKSTKSTTNIYNIEEFSIRETLLIGGIVLLFSIVCCESYLCKTLYGKINELERRIKRIDSLRNTEMPIVMASPAEMFVNRKINTK